MKPDLSPTMMTEEHSILNCCVCDITVGIPTYRRPEKLKRTLRKIYDCYPVPAEVIVHVDGGDKETEALLLTEFPQVQVIKSTVSIGPGGGRNKIIARASHRIVASFDDDSYPIDSDYFISLLRQFERFPNAAVIGSKIFHIGSAISELQDKASWVANFTGCGCAYQRDTFTKTSGYVELPIAYGMEEVDLALQLQCSNWGILESSLLRVFHDTQLAHHIEPRIVAGSLANIALLVYLRYPFNYWLYGLLQYLNRIYWQISHQRWTGILQGICDTPRLVYQHRHLRQPVSSHCLIKYLHLRRRNTPAIAQSKE